MTAPLVRVNNLTVAFTAGGGSGATAARPVRAVNGVDFALAPGEVLGVLGESGSGKSVTLRALLRILPKARTQISGSIEVDGRDVLAMDESALENYRGAVVSMMIFRFALRE